MSSLNPRSQSRLEALRRAGAFALSTASACAFLGTTMASPRAFAQSHAAANSALKRPNGSTNAAPSVLTYHNDAFRTGLNSHETLLTPTSVATGYTQNGVNYVFTKQFNLNVEGSVYAQPLYVSNVKYTDPFTGGAKVGNLVIIVTAHNTVYAYADDNRFYANSRPIWRVDYNYDILQIGTIPVSALNDSVTTSVSDGMTTFTSTSAIAEDVQNEFGIIGTPAIEYDATKQGGRIYFVVATKEGTDYFQRLHVLDLSTGAELGNSPLLLMTTVTVPSPVPQTFLLGYDPLRCSQRGALTVKNGTVYIPWGAHNYALPSGTSGTADSEDKWSSTIQTVNASAAASNHSLLAAYHFDGTNFQLYGKFDPAADSVGNAINMCGSGPAMDSVFLYFSTTGGTFNANTGGRSYANSVLQTNYTLNWPPNGIRSYFTPYNVHNLNTDGIDLGTGGVMALPDPVTGAGQKYNQYLLTTAGVEGNIYLLLRAYQNLGGYNQFTDNVYQKIPNAVGPVYGPPAYFNNKVYYAGVGDTLTAFSFYDRYLLPNATDRTSNVFDFPGAIPTISSNGNTNGIVWAVETSHTGTNGKEILRAYDAANLSHSLYTAQVAGDTAHIDAIPYTVPTIANGRVYVGGTKTVGVFGFVVKPSSKKH